MSGFTGPYRVVKTFGLAGPLAVEMTMELVHNASKGHSNLQANSIGSLLQPGSFTVSSWCDVGHVPHTGSSCEVKRPFWESLKFNAVGSPQGKCRREDEIHQAFFTLGINSDYTPKP